MSEVSTGAGLLPCPFCGSEASLGIVTEGGEANPDFGGHFVQCNNERCHGCMGLRFACGDDPRPALIDAWNQRATPEPTTDLVEQVARAIDDACVEWQLDHARKGLELARWDVPGDVMAKAAIAAMPDRAALVGEAERSEKHRNDLADKITAQSVELGSLRTQLAASQADVARLREGVADMANQMKIVGSHYNQAQEALDGIVADVKSRARAILKEKTP